MRFRLLVEHDLLPAAGIEQNERGAVRRRRSGIAVRVFDDARLVVRHEGCGHRGRQRGSLRQKLLRLSEEHVEADVVGPALLLNPVGALFTLR